MAYDFYVRSRQDLIDAIQKVGIIPYFSTSIPGFSLEEHCSPAVLFSDSGDDTWEWKGPVIQSTGCAYGKLFEKKSTYVRSDLFLDLANYRRDGYDFDARWEDGLASRREKAIMDLLTDRDEDGDVIWTEKQILTTDLKKIAGFGKSRSLAGKGAGAGKNAQGMRENEGTGAAFKNFQGVVTGLMMQTYLVTVDFHRRENKRGEEYGMPVSVMLPPEAVWGYELVTSAYSEKEAIFRSFFPAPISSSSRRFSKALRSRFSRRKLMESRPSLRKKVILKSESSLALLS